MSRDPTARKTQRYRRVEVEVDVRISTIDPETDPDTGAPYFRTSEETCANVSRGGAYVETSETVAPGRRLLLELDLPSGEPLQTVGRVAWTKAQIQTPDGEPRTGMGIEFVDGSPEELRRLEEFLDDALPSQPGSSSTGA
jgi:Tfp pilus assembly protein PilZ